MYTKIGKKIQILAEVCGILCLITSAFALIFVLAFVINEAEMSISAFSVVIGGVVGFIGSWPLYGFGQLVEDVSALRKRSESPAEIASDELPEL